jgi:hypothetical protein
VETTEVPPGEQVAPEKVNERAWIFVSADALGRSFAPLYLRA